MHSVFGEELEILRTTARRFFKDHLDPRTKEFEANGPDRTFWREAGKAGLLGTQIPESYGGHGASPLAAIVIAEELGRSPGGVWVGSAPLVDLATNFLIESGTEEQKQYWFPKILSGEAIQCMALSEPDAGSDAAAIRTTATRDGDHYVINGMKSPISVLAIADLIYTIVKTDSHSRGLTCIIVPSNTPGITRRRLETIGWPGGSTGEIFYDNVRVPVTNLVGEEGRAMRMFHDIVAIDRFQIAAMALTAAEAAFELTLEYARNRNLFRRRLIDFQNTQFKLAEMETELAVGRGYMNSMVQKFQAGEFRHEDAAMAKIWLPEMEARVIDGWVQLWGGQGFMKDNLISRMYQSARVERLHAGTTEIQKDFIARRYLVGNGGIQ